MPELPPKTASAFPVSWILTSIFALAMIMIYLIPPSSQVLFPAFAQVRETGFYPDGLPVRRTYTGIYVIDEMCTGLAGLFSAASDGRDFATHLFCLWFLPQLCAVLTFIYWEAGKVDSRQFRFARLPTFFGVLAQLIAAGPTLPLYFIAHMRGVPLVPRALPINAPARAYTLLPAIILGFVVPSAALFLVPTSSMSLDTKQIIAAIWQPFPLYIAILYPMLASVVRAISPSLSSEKDNREGALRGIELSYTVSGVLSAVAHWTIFLPAVFPKVMPSFIAGHDDPSVSFRHIFIPYILHSYLPESPAQVPELPPYRLAARLLFQHDWLYMTLAAFVFFAWHQSLVTRSNTGAVSSTRLANWFKTLAAYTCIGGPGAAFAWAAVQRERVLDNLISAQETQNGHTTQGVPGERKQ